MPATSTITCWPSAVPSFCAIVRPMHASQDGRPQWAKAADDRVTRVGRMNVRREHRLPDAIGHRGAGQGECLVQALRAVVYPWQQMAVQIDHGVARV